MQARSQGPATRLVMKSMQWLAAGSGKTTTLEGGRGKDTRGSSEGDGLMHLAIDELFELLHGKAVTVGEGGRASHALRHAQPWSAHAARGRRAAAARRPRRRSG